MFDTLSVPISHTNVKGLISCNAAYADARAGCQNERLLHGRCAAGYRL
jgi:hypothetical protein